MRGFRRAAIVVGTTILVAGGLSTTALALRGDDTPHTICHKPGTAAQHELTIDNDSLYQAHLEHGDLDGPCTTAAPETPPAGDEGTAAEAVTATPNTAG